MEGFSGQAMDLALVFHRRIFLPDFWGDWATPLLLVEEEEKEVRLSGRRKADNNRVVLPSTIYAMIIIMRIYISHSTDHSYDFRKFLYEPLQASALMKEHTLIFPHDRDYGDEPRNMKDEIIRSAFLLAEVSYPSTGMGIELGWASDHSKPIFCLYEYGKDYSRALLVLTKHIDHYAGAGEMVEKVEKFIHDNQQLK